MKAIPDNTLAYYERLPQLHLINLANVPCGTVCTNIKAYKSALEADTNVETMASPDVEALSFYLFNHLSSIIKDRFTKHEVLPEWAAAVMREYRDIVSQQGIRLISYIALITTRENRHLSGKPDSFWDKQIVKPFGDGPKNFHFKIKSKNSGDVVTTFLNNPPQCSVGQFFKAIEVMFSHGGYSHGYGGKPWANITKCLNQFLDGNTTQEMMIDTAYTLAHNNGPMFNKGMLYEGYSSDFMKLLDIQRSGQIPEFVIEYAVSSGISPKQYALFSEARKYIGNEFGTYVDWYKVEDLGALGSYYSQKVAQDKKYGKPKVQATDFEGHKAEQIGVFKIFSGVEVPIYQRLTTA